MPIAAATCNLNLGSFVQPLRAIGRLRLRVWTAHTRRTNTHTLSEGRIAVTETVHTSHCWPPAPEVNSWQLDELFLGDCSAGTPPHCYRFLVSMVKMVFKGTASDFYVVKLICHCFMFSYNAKLSAQQNPTSGHHYFHLKRRWLVWRWSWSFLEINLKQQYCFPKQGAEISDCLRELCESRFGSTWADFCVSDLCYQPFAPCSDFANTIQIPSSSFFNLQFSDPDTLIGCF